MQRGIQVTLKWVHRHCRVPDNEKADELTKVSVVRGAEDKEAFTSIAYLERQVKNTATDSWADAWETNTVKRKYYTGHSKNNVPSSPYSKENQVEQVILSRLHTGHINCKAYLHQIGKADEPKCHYGALKQDIPYIFLRCPSLDKMRKQV